MECSSGTDDDPDTQVSLREEERKQCWVCFCTEEDDMSASWVRPCNCKGTSKWVHQLCLQRWVDEKQKGNPLGKVSCPQCNTEYIIVYPDMGPLIVILDSFNTVIYRICPVVAAGVMVGSVYWVAVTYGAITVMQTMGLEQALRLMESVDPLILLSGLPTIPIVLILSKLIKWEDTALMFLRRNARKVPVLKYILPSFTWYSPESAAEQSEVVPPFTDPISATRVICSALILPTMATITGNLFFRSVQSNIQRTILGGIAFLTIKGILKIYHKQQHYIRQCQRKILDYPTPSPARTPEIPGVNLEGKNATQAGYKMCPIWGEGAAAERTVRKWFAQHLRENHDARLQNTERARTCRAENEKNSRENSRDYYRFSSDLQGVKNTGSEFVSEPDEL